jgi:hypothetical protein
VTTVTGPADPAVLSAPGALLGRNRVSERALRRVASAITAEAMGVSPREVTVVLADDRGLLGVSALTPIRVRPLGSRPPGSAQGADDTVLNRATMAQTTIRERMLALTGSEVGRVSIRLTSTTSSSSDSGKDGLK